MKLCDYKNLNVGREEFTPVTNDEVQAELLKLVESKKTLVAKEGKSENGDTVNIDYKGFLGEEQFEGGTADGYDLALGSNTFIPGFEEQLVGYEKGADVDVNVTFPEQYHSQKLAGQPVVFKCHINEVKVQNNPEFNDEFAQEFNFNTKEDLLAELERQMNAKKQNDLDNNYLTKLMDYIVNNSEVTPDEEAVKARIDEMMSYYEQQIMQYGMDINSYLAMSGMTIEAFRDQLATEALKSASEDCIFAEIIKLENITATDEELAKELAIYKDYYQLDDVRFEEFKASESEAVKESLLKRKACVLLIESNN